MNSSSQNKEVAKISFFVAAPDDWGEMTFGEVRGGEAARAELCGAAASPVRGSSETPVEFEPFRFGHQQVFCLFTVF